MASCDSPIASIELAINKFRLQDALIHNNQALTSQIGLAKLKTSCTHCDLLHEAILIVSILASLPGSRVGEEEREPDTHCLHMHQVSLVTCIPLRYSKIHKNFYLSAERPHCRILLPVRHLQVVLKSQTILL